MALALFIIWCCFFPCCDVTLLL